MRAFFINYLIIRNSFIFVSFLNFFFHQILHVLIHGSAEITRALTMRRQSTFMKSRVSNPSSRNKFLVWLVGANIVFSDMHHYSLNFLSLYSFKWRHRFFLLKLWLLLINWFSSHYFQHDFQIWQVKFSNDIVFVFSYLFLFIAGVLFPSVWTVCSESGLPYPPQGFYHGKPIFWLVKLI